MPVYSGPHYTVLLVPETGSRAVHRRDVTVRQWDRSFHDRYDVFPDYEIIGRGRNLNVELFEEEHRLRKDLEAIDNTVTLYDPYDPTSIYGDASMSARTLTQRLADTLYSALLADEGTVAYAIIAGTEHDYLLVCSLARPATAVATEAQDAAGSAPPGAADASSSSLSSLPATVTFSGVAYPVLGAVVDGEPRFLAAAAAAGSGSGAGADAEARLRRFLVEDGRSALVRYRWLELAGTGTGSGTGPDDKSAPQGGMAEDEVAREARARARREKRRGRRRARSGKGGDGVEALDTHDAFMKDEARVASLRREPSHADGEKAGAGKLGRKGVHEIDKAVEEIRNGPRRADVR